MASSEALDIGIMGAGSIGCFVGGRLVASDSAKVTFVGRPRLAETNAAHGLTLQELDDSRRVDGSGICFKTDVRSLSSCDVVLCCVKSGATRETALALSEVLDPGTVVVSLQNGVRNQEVLREHLPLNRVVPGVVGFNVVMHDNAVFQLSTTGPLVIEATDDPIDRACVGALEKAGFEVRVVDPIAPEQWTKLLVNLNNAISALSGAPTPTMILSRQYRRVMSMLLDEGLDVLETAGIQTAKFRGVPLRMMSLILRLPTPIVRLVVRAQLRVDPESRASMWQDLERRRPTEVDFLNGEIVRLADAHSIDAPHNRRIVELVHEAERTAAGSPRTDGDALLDALGRTT
jgi:2-dehydropantoate 2-reductase